MSSTLTIEPSEREKQSLSTDLKFALRKREKRDVFMSVSEDDIPYFKGLHDAGIEDAYKVIEFIEKYGDCTLQEEY